MRRDSVEEFLSVFRIANEKYLGARKAFFCRVDLFVWLNVLKPSKQPSRLAGSRRYFDADVCQVVVQYGRCDVREAAQAGEG